MFIQCARFRLRLRAKKFSIYLLQETHSTENTTPVWSAEWGLTSLFTSYSSSSGGVAILFNNNFTFQLQRSFLDNTGRFVICDIKTNEKLITLATIYAPNEDDPSFFERFHNHLRDFQCDDIIIGGDFNQVLDIEMDKKGGLAKTHTKAVTVIKDCMAELDLVDAWRLLNPDGQRYTWRPQKPEIRC